MIALVNLRNERARQRARTALVRQMLVLERVFQRDLRRFLDRQWARMAAQVALGNTSPKPTGSGELMELLGRHARRVLAVFGAVGLEAAQAGRKQASPEQVYWRTVQGATSARTLGAKITAINETTRNRVRTVIKRGMTDGLPMMDIAKQINEAGSFANMRRAQMIARTETHSVATEAVNASVQSTGLELWKRWVAAIDTRTRKTHAAMNSKPAIPPDKPFIVGGEALMMPGDRNGPPGEIINCRCVLLYEEPPAGTVKPPVVPPTPPVPPPVVPPPTVVAPPVRVPKPKPVPKPVPTEWVAPKDLSEAKERLKGLGVRELGISAVEFGGDKWLMRGVASDTLREVESLAAQFPKVGRSLRKNPVSEIKLHHSELIRHDDGDALGLYFQFAQRVEIASLQPVRLAEQMQVGVGIRSFGVGDSFNCTLRHELGHHYYRCLSRADERSFLLKLRDVIKKEGIPGPEFEAAQIYFKKHVSTYAGTNVSEGFAEAFAAYTAPTYRTGAHRLPKALEELFEGILGKGAK